MQTVNDKIQLTHSSFVYYVVSIVCTTVNRNLTVHNMLITFGILKVVSNVYGEVDKVREERLRKRRGCNRLRRERETNEQRHARFVNLCPCLSLFTFQ